MSVTAEPKLEPKHTTQETKWTNKQIFITKYNRKSLTRREKTQRQLINKKHSKEGLNSTKSQGLDKVTKTIQNLAKQRHETKGLAILGKARAWSWFSDTQDELAQTKGDADQI